MKGTPSGIRDEVARLPVIDTHEHLLWEEELRAQDDTDVLKEYLTHYLKSDLFSAGLTQDAFDRVIDTKLDIEDRWRLVEPFWEACRYTGYGQALDAAVRAIYGVDRIGPETIVQLNDRFQACRKPGHYAHVLRDLCGITVSLLDVWTFRLTGENPLFRRIWQPQNFINPMPPEGSGILAYIEKKHGIAVRCLDDWLQALEKELDDVLASYGVRVLKTGIAYFRTLRFEKTAYRTARAGFAAAMRKAGRRGSQEGGGLELPREVQDFVMHHLLGLASARRLTIQIHTGLLEGNGNTLANSDPTLLNNLFLEYPAVRFDLFHISYPYQAAACALCKMFPNVFIDMCWAHIISPSAARQALDGFLDAVPWNKISAFGGDYLFVDGVYGHLQIARQNVSEVLEGKVAQGLFSTGTAVEIAKALFFDNPNRIFQLGLG